ncbi:Ig-like domain-containing protein [Candidatus Palauibacter sp.]|uniref:Ig-like domain-containing protein n=1 Tax=Candidatus Palauibacter sp. TaxID=3101350 RepID=UPI003B52FE91
MQVGTIPNQALATGQSATLEVSSHFRDPDGGALTYTAASSAAGIVSVSLSGSTLTMVGVADGTATVTVTARDPDGLTASQGFSVTVETPNRAPEAVGTIPNQSVATGQTATLAVSSYFRDPDGDALTYTAASSAAAVISVSLSGSTLTMVGVADGSGTVTVTARDLDGLTAMQNFQVTVETPNRAPEAVGTIPTATVATGGTTTVDVSSYFRDPDGDRLTYTAATSDAAVATAAVSGSSVTISAAAAGTATVTVTARDPGGLTAAQGFRVTVATSNTAPEAVGTIPTATVATGGTTTVDVSSYFRDPDGDRLTYTAATSNAAVATVAVSSSRVTISAVAAGTATVRVTARDPGGLTAAQRFGVTVRGGGGGAGFRDDFDSSASLGDWEIENANAVVANGILRLTPTSDTRRGYADRTLEAPLTEWTIRARMGRATSEGTVRVYWFTGDANYPALGFSLGPAGDDNFRFLYFDAEDRQWYRTSDLAGNSDAVRDAPGEFTDLTIGRDGAVVFMAAGETELLRFTPSARFRPALQSVTRVWLAGSNRSSAVHFDWVEVTGDADGGGGGGDACTVGLVLSPGESCTFSGGTFEVLSNGCVRVGSGGGSICAQNININGLRATRLSGNRWEILGLPSGDAGDGSDLTVRSVFGLTEASEVKKGTIGLTIETLGIRRRR